MGSNPDQTADEEDEDGIVRLTGFFQLQSSGSGMVVVVVNDIALTACELEYVHR